MEQERSFVTRALSLIGFGLLAFAITILAGGIWSALLVANLRSSPAVPWSVPVMALMLWLMWGYLGGKGWPQSTSDTRRHHLRAKRRSARTYLWSFAAGVLSVVALAGYWIVLFRLVKMPPNSLPDVSSYPRITIALMILMGSLVAPFMEEAGFRGYFQVALEREFRGSVAVAVSSLVFAFAHMYGLLLDRCNASVIRDQTQQELTSRICREQGRTFRNKQKPTNSVLDALLIARASQ